jgi:uncharacterized membrane protein YphA (DoxX/SURF4 family)
MALVFAFSGGNKAYFNEIILVKKGQTGVEGLPSWLIKFIGISEIFGALGLVVPMLVDQYTFLTPLAAACLGCIMFPAAYIHTKRGEPFNVAINITLLMVCAAIAYFRW